MRSGLRRGVVLPVLVVGLLTGCGEEPAVIDYGEFATTPVPGDYDSGPSKARGILVESLRLGERIAFGDQIDPDLTRTTGGAVMVDHRGLAPGRNTLSGAQTEALGKFDIQGAFGMTVTNEDTVTPETKSVSITLLAFADEPTAAIAAGDMARADFEQSIENVPVAVADFPTALSHWRPAVPTVGSWMTWKNLVIRVFAQVPEPRPELISDVLAKTYRAELAELADFVPTPTADLPQLKLDPDTMLTRLVKTGEYEFDNLTFAVYGRRAFAMQWGGRKAETLFSSTEVTSVAVAHNKFLWHTATEQSAERLAAELVRSPEKGFRPIGGVPGISGVSCTSADHPTKNENAIRFECVVRRNQYVAIVRSYLESDIRKLAAAQYALMAQDR